MPCWCVNMAVLLIQLNHKLNIPQEMHYLTTLLKPILGYTVVSYKEHIYHP